MNFLTRNDRRWGPKGHQSQNLHYSIWNYFKFLVVFPANRISIKMIKIGIKKFIKIWKY